MGRAEHSVQHWYLYKPLFYHKQNDTWWGETGHWFAVSNLVWPISHCSLWTISWRKRHLYKHQFKDKWVQIELAHEGDHLTTGLREHLTTGLQEEEELTSLHNLCPTMKKSSQVCITYVLPPILCLFVYLMIQTACTKLTSCSAAPCLCISFQTPLLECINNSYYIYHWINCISFKDKD